MSKDPYSFTLAEGLRNDATGVSIPTSSIIVLLVPDPDDEVFTLYYTSASTTPELKILKLLNPPSILQDIFHPPYPRPAHSSQNIHLIISTHSGTHKAKAYADEFIIPLVEALSLDITTWETTSSTHIAELTTQILSTSKDDGADILIIFLSGDTGVHEHINALPSSSSSASGTTSKHTIAVLPLGTGNALATSWKLDLRTLIFGSKIHLPTATVTFSPGSKLVADGADVPKDGLKAMVVCSWGFHASLVAGSDTPEYRKYGVDRFSMVGGDLMRQMHPYSGKLTAFLPDGSSRELGDKHCYVMLPLVENLVSNFRISPKMKVGGEEVFMVYMSASISAEKLGEAMGYALDPAGEGEHVDMDEVEYFPVTGWRVEMDEPDKVWRQVCVDGRIVEVSEGGWVEVRLDKKEDKEWGVLSATPLI